MLLATPIVYHIDESRKITLTNIYGLQYADEQKTAVNCLIVIAEMSGEPIPFTASKFDNLAHGREIYNDIMSGLFGDIADPA